MAKNNGTEKKYTVADIMAKLDAVESRQKKIEVRNEYCILRFEGLMKAILNVDELPDLSGKSPKSETTRKAEADVSDLFDSSEVAI